MRGRLSGGTGPGRAWTVLVVLAGIGLLGSGTSRAEPRLSGGVTVVGLASGEDDTDAELSASVDLFLAFRPGPGTLRVYVEGSTSPRDRGVGRLVPESNGDAGTALSRDGSGRVQISEFKYALSLSGGATLDSGLIDVTAYLDTTRINNDENMQFLGTSFLNNPTIEFPDYTLGFVYHREPEARGPAVSLALTSSDGLADHPDASYERLFDLTAAGKGIFLGAEAGWQTRARRYRVGAWLDTAEHPRLDGAPDADDNHGMYATIDVSRGRHAANLRVGAAKESVSPVRTFTSVTYQHSWGDTVLGLGVARSWSSEDLVAATTHATQVEAYLRTAPTARVFVTPSVQYVRDSTFGLTDPDVADSVLVYGLRLRARF